MKKLVLVLSVLLVGCSTTVPVKMKFPDVPPELLESCLDLEKVPKDTKQLSTTAEVVIKNYSKYHTCKGRVEDWKEWYNSQKKIFDEIK
jgi:hypothetical protein